MPQTQSPATSAPPITAPNAELSEQEVDYLFDLNGYHIIKNALTAEQLAAVNAYVDTHDTGKLEPGQWLGDVEIHTYGSQDGINFQNILEGGPVFEQLIDHPAWIDRVRRYIEVDDHLLRIDECFLNVRRRGGYIGIHSGGHNRRFTGLFRWHTGQWAVGQINVLMALTDVGPGDGCTTIIPGSHKSHEKHPFMHQEGVFHKHGGNALAMREVHMNAGDVIMFADGTCHGSIERTNPGERRVLIYRYAPHLLASRYNYLPSEELMARLTPERRRIVMPVPPRMRPGRTLEAGAYEK